MPFGSIISAGLGLLGGLQSDKATRRENERNREHAREMAQYGIRWRAADARAAGIHPVYALGAPAFSPATSVGAPTGFASALASAGQDISRAVSASSSAKERDRLYEDQVKALTLKRMGLENEVLASQAAKTRAQLGPPIPTLDSSNESRPRLGIIGDIGATPRKKEAQAQKLEDEYGDWTSVFGALRLLRDMGYDIAHSEYQKFQKFRDEKRKRRKSSRKPLAGGAW